MSRRLLKFGDDSHFVIIAINTRFFVPKFYSYTRGQPGDPPIVTQNLFSKGFGVGGVTLEMRSLGKGVSDLSIMNWQGFHMLKILVFFQ